VFTTPQTVEVKAEATDNVAVSKVWFIRNGVVVSTDNAFPYEYNWTISGADNGPYTWAVKAFDAVGNSSTTAGVPVTVAMDHQAPSAPAGLTAEGLVKSMTLAWAASSDEGGSGIKGYSVDLSTEPTFDSYLPGWNNKFLGLAVSTTVGNLALDTVYYARVLAQDNNGNMSSYSAPVSARTAVLNADVELTEGWLGVRGTVSKFGDTWTYFESAETGGHYAYKRTTSGLSTSDSLRFSVMVKATEAPSRDVSIMFYNTDITANRATAKFTLSGAGTVSVVSGGETTGATGSISAQGGGWYLCSVSARPDSENGSKLTFLIWGSVGGNTTYAGNTSAGFQFKNPGVTSLPEDTRPPTVAIPTPTAGTTFNAQQTVSIQAAASDNVAVDKVWFLRNSVVVSTDNAFPYEYNWTISGADNGPHTWTATAFDAIGNSSTTAPVPVTVNIDVTNPSVTLSTPTAGTTFITPQTVPVRANATDNVGVTKVWFFQNGVVVSTDTVSPYEYGWSITGSNNGAHNWSARAFDAIGNSSTTASVAVTVNIDGTNPLVTLSTPTAGTTFITPQTVPVRANATDNVGVTKVWFVLNDVVVSTDTQAPYLYSWAVTAANNGAHSWRATAFDAIGNSSTTAVVPVTVNIDVTRPSVAITTPTANAVFTTPQTVTVKANATDNVGVSKVWFILDGVMVSTDTVSPYEYGWLITGANNEAHTWSATAFDAIGNSSTTASVPVTVNIDFLPPSVPAGLQAVAITSTSLSLSWSLSTDNVGVAGYRIRRGTSTLATVESGGTSFTENGLSANTFYLYGVLAFDAAGNESAVSPDLAVTTARAPLLAPSGSVTGVTSRSIAVRWEMTANATRYHLAASQSNNTAAPFSLQQETAGTNDSLSGLTPNTTYYFFLNACDETDCTAFALAGQAVTHATVPTLKSVEVMGREARLTIDPQGNPAGTLYRIETSRGGGSYAPVANGKDVAFVVGGLTPGERYQFRVTAENHGGVKTSFSNVVAAVLAPETVNEARAYPVPFRPGLGRRRSPLTNCQREPRFEYSPRLDRR
jgi:chitodextrinase